MGDSMKKARTSADVRRHLVSAVEADLVGPFDDSGHETLELHPSRWYLTGFLAPQEDRESTDPTDDDELGAGDDTDVDDANPADPAAKRRGFLPASIGMSFLLPPGDASDTLRIRVQYADYVITEAAPEVEEDGDGKKRKKRARKLWTRTPKFPDAVEVPLDVEKLSEGLPVPDSGGLRIVGHLKEADLQSGQLESGTRAISLFVVNNRPKETTRGQRDLAYVFQVEMTVVASCGFVPRPNPRDERSDDWDASIADLQFRNIQEYGVGHGVAVKTVEVDGERALRTTWIPSATVKRVKTRREESVTTEMGALANLEDGESARQALEPIIGHYGAWIEAQLQRDVGTEARSETRDELMKKAERAKKRIAEGIDVVASDEKALDAFRLANEAMEMAALQRSPERYEGEAVPAWRLFQLAFILMNVPSITDDLHEDRETVELIFFPTGGGKTEAYLGVVAYTLILRRLKGQNRPDKGLGVAVILRYTLRLLTLDQLGRAATLICALEVLRTKGRPTQDSKKRQPIERLGEARFSIGLWVGRSATANTLKWVARQIIEYKNSKARNAASPFPLTGCPWCRTPFQKSSFELKPTKTSPDEVVVGCSNFRCDFSAGKNESGLPVLFVDEQIYSELPSFLVATVDKFALLPWRGETGKMMGRVHSMTVRKDGVARFFGAIDSEEPHPDHEGLSHGLVPPELIVQDELHLIAGPLGTMVGLYETAIEMLCTYKGVSDKLERKPKILASTATVKRAKQHIHSLFGRSDMAIFPPQGVDDGENYFSTEDTGGPDTAIEAIRRMYIGVAAFGRPMKTILLRAYTALLNAAARHYSPKGEGRQPADPYMTLAGYFNSLRELGGMRRLVEDDVRSRSARAEDRIPYKYDGPHPWFENRDIQVEPVELTSRESTFNITVAKSRLEQNHIEKGAVDVVLASNMISVGVDIDRLGLMVVAGQPKTTSEYIQASSRVGRDRSRPGLVVTCYNLHKSRDRSHYEHFVAYHESFYRYVEATSLTPFSGPALDRGLAGTVVAMTRLADDSMVPPNAVEDIRAKRSIGEKAVEELAERAASLIENQEQAVRVANSLRARGRNLLDTWEKVIDQTHKDAGQRRYSPWEPGSKGKSLLYTSLDEEADEARTQDEAYFVAPTSMRDVEPSVHVWVYRRHLKKEGLKNAT